MLRTVLRAMLPIFALASPAVHDVYVVFSTHLDIGYDLPYFHPKTNATDILGSSAIEVINRYFEKYFPAAMETAKHSDFKWMTQSWLVSLYRNCGSIVTRSAKDSVLRDLHCPSAAALSDFDAAARRRDITWHAFPFNAEPEMFDSWLFDAALNLTFTEDQHYGHAPRKTLSQRDVPGLTRASLPLLNRAGVKAVSVGENVAASPLNLPRVFLWRDKESGSEAIAMFHKGGYGGEEPPSSARMTARIEKKLGAVGANDCIEVLEAQVALCYSWKNDNTGPHNTSEVAAVYKQVQALYPDVNPKRIVPSDAFDDFVERVWPFRSKLPAVEAEIGDTWIYGASSDPLKVATYRAISRARRGCVERPGHSPESESSKSLPASLPACGCSSAQLRDFERLLMLVGEHTWGSDGGGVRNSAWSNSELRTALASPDPTPDQDPNPAHLSDFHMAVRSWKEQRQFIEAAVQALPPHSFLARSIAHELRAISPLPGGEHSEHGFDTTGFSDVPLLDSVWPKVWEANLTSGCVDQQLEGQEEGRSRVRLAFGADGSLVYLSGLSGKPWASPKSRLASLLYQGLDSATMGRFVKEYAAGAEESPWNFGKPGFSDGGSVNATPTVTGFMVRLEAAQESPVTPDSGSISGSKPLNKSLPSSSSYAAEFLLSLRYPQSLVESGSRGAPQSMQVLVQIPRLVCQDKQDEQQPGQSSQPRLVSLMFTARWINKTATHAPESLWLVNRPRTTSRAGFRLHKMGSLVNPLDADLSAPIIIADSSNNYSQTSPPPCVFPNQTCGVHLHAVSEDGVEYSENRDRFAIQPLDSVLVSVGEPIATPTPLVVPDPLRGMHFSLFNNIWNTNYPFWYPFVKKDADSQFRFRYVFS